MSTTLSWATSPEGDGELVVTRDGAVATLWLNRPAKRNAVTYDMWLGIAEVCAQLGSDDAVRLLVVRGAGAHFCAGADVGGLGAVDAATYRAANEAADAALAAFPKPTLAAITGSCVGGGCELAIACDLRIADETARFGITPARLGLVYPASALERAVARLGPAVATYLIFTADLVGAAEAARFGLVHEVHAEDAFAGRVADLTESLTTRRSLLTQVATKAMLADIAAEGQVRTATQDRWFAALTEAADPVEGVVAFVEKRDPRFTWTPGDAPPDGHEQAARIGASDP